MIRVQVDVRSGQSEGVLLGILHGKCPIHPTGCPGVVTCLAVETVQETHEGHSWTLGVYRRAGARWIVETFLEAEVQALDTVPGSRVDLVWMARELDDLVGGRTDREVAELAGLTVEEVRDLGPGSSLLVWAKVLAAFELQLVWSPK